MDTLIVIIRRLQRHKSLFEADKNHLHHFLNSIKENTRFTVMILGLMQVVFSIIGYQLQHSNEFLSLILFMILFHLYFTLFDQRLKRRADHNYKIKYFENKESVYSSSDQKIEK